ncbi:MAG: hypothetical protein ACR652_10220 [Methylocystis sp.]|uniref:hypothetical protein n=1 Tax=Methylocystis sp. TaxID=1911079 RepID=UPI003DA29FD1
MGFFSFLRSQSADAAATVEGRVVAIAEDLQAVESERARLHGEIAGHAAKRKAMLIDESVSEDQLIKFDMTTERHHARLERLDELERVLQGRLQDAQRELAERAARETFDERHNALEAFHEAMTVALAKLEAVQRTHEQHHQAARAAGQSAHHWGDGPLVISPEAVQNFGKRLASSRAHEDSRRAAVDNAHE